MLRRQHGYLMEIDAEFNEALKADVVEKYGERAEAAVGFAVQSWIDHVDNVGKDALKATRQKWRGFECDQSGKAPRFAITFNGDTAGASQAYGLWCDGVSGLGGTGRILVARLRGSEGTDYGYMDDNLAAELRATYDALSKEDQDFLNQWASPKGG